ncbi:FAD-dependent oxidoreductase [Malonomonas rubra]|uniref:FAD-dependent oxidoreductase n=1 Tax=Malonomonas rubra TaxID=57040 RepID=UPI0026EBDE61|nr:FAD-dependent oxidoreductase [Malonomonas rubra]
MAEKFDCIIVGAGPAGLTAALALARAGVEVLVLERGEYPGSKNMFGGVLYSKGLHELIPDFWDEAPVERPVARWGVSFLDQVSAMSLDFKSEQFCTAPYNAFTVLRSKFDRWYAGKVEGAGAVLLTDTTVVDFLREGGRVVGVQTNRPDGELRADVVIAADGINSLLCRKGGSGLDLSADEVSLGVKEIIALPREAINKAFALNGDEGAAYTYVGSATKGIPGGGFIYTNQDSLSIGVVTKLSSLSGQDQRPEELLEAFKRHPLIWPLVKEGELREYAAHLIPEGGGGRRAPLFADGVLAVGDAAGFTLSTGLRVEGVNYSIMSGLAAAEAVKGARLLGDYTRRGLSAYPQALKKHGVLADLEKFKRTPHFFKTSRLYQEYPALACELGHALFGVEPGPKKGMFTIFKEQLKGRVAWPQLLTDAFAGWRGLS